MAGLPAPLVNNGERASGANLHPDSSLSSSETRTPTHSLHQPQMSLPHLLSRFRLLGKRGKLINNKALASYEYTPLDEAAHEIRLLTLHQGKRRDPIMITLTRTPFTVDNVPAFEALSYTWGSPENPTNIFATDSSGISGTLSVTKNLGEALPYLRYEDKDRVLWIDAISVNQRDQTERSRQVQHMAEIYSKAVRVVAWLGPSTKLTPVAIRCFNTITSNVKVDWLTAVLEPVSSDLSWADLTVAPPFSNEECLAMVEFLGSEWFERLWIQQEIRLSPVESILLRGQHVIQWISFRNAVYFLQNKMHLRFPTQPFSDRIKIASNVCNYSPGPSVSIRTLLQQTKNCKCSDPRDRIFALLSLVPKSMRGFGITPDYTKSVQDVYTDAFKSIVSVRANLDILLAVEMDESTQWTPTWVPDWSHPRSSFQMLELYASCKSRGVPRFPSERIMQIEGIIVDSIALTEPFQSQNFGRNQTAALELKRVVSPFMPTISEMDEFRLKSLCRALCAGHFSDEYVPPRTCYTDFVQAGRHIREILFAQWPQSVSSFSHSSLFGVIKTLARGRCLCETNKGRIVLGPRTTRHGDVVSVLLGCSNPVILRPIQDGSFEVVGEAYCDEIVNGEALTGSIPEGFTMVHKWNEDRQGYYYVFLDLETGNFQPEDPRLSLITLPPGWRKKDHELGEWFEIFVNDTTGEETLYNPRLTAEALKERGVDIQILNLV